jgi:hypothetical protein
MNRFRACSSLLFTCLLTLACGSGVNSNARQLQSITVAQTANGNQIQLVATGTFSSMPTTVTPLPVQWTDGLMAPPPPVYNYTLTTQPYVFNCTSAGPIVVVAFAPPNPNAPISGSANAVVTGNAVFTCP